MSESVPSPFVDGITHHTAQVNGTVLHYVSAGSTGSPILLVHGFPETWWAFHKLIPLLASNHRVFAVDLRGFGDSSIADDTHDSSISAADLHHLIRHLDVGPVHLSAQDIAGATVFRLATAHPEDVLSLTAIEMGLAGFGLEGFADVTRGGSWHIGVLAAPGISDLLLSGRERDFLGNWAFPAMTAVAESITDTDIDEFTRTYARPGGWRGAGGLYRSMLDEGEDIIALAKSTPLTVPVLAVGASGGSFTAITMRSVSAGKLTAIQLDGVGHYVALEAPAALSKAMMHFLAETDSERQPTPTSFTESPTAM
ncbi:alpha/beta fold hydrolase [Rhodococcus sp. 077-4]|uniref:alpha/beta fold hydrolase n=1 Tax=Rhodococcus sp. 077-4 TaxID=2789271 RepID=UPI0039F469CC